MNIFVRQHDFLARMNKREGQAFWAARDLENKLLSFRDFYNDQRCHYALDGDTPSERAGKKRGNNASLDSYAWQSHCRGLFQLPVAA